MLNLHVEIESDFYLGIDGDLTHANVQKLKKTVQHHMKSTCLVTMDIVVNIPKGIPRSEGKAIRIVDKRNSAMVSV